MTIITDLAESAAADVDVLRTLDRQGDVFKLSRPVDFVFLTDSDKQADALSGFLVDYQYASVTREASAGVHRVVATIHMPIEQNIILTVSGFMQCMATLFSVTYDGWGTVAQKK